MPKTASAIARPAAGSRSPRSARRRRRGAEPAELMSAAAKAATVSNRSAGVLESARPTARSTAAGTPGRAARRLRTCSVINRAMTTWAVGPVWGGSPEGIS